ncbi:YerC/YecD family TrpR-related protein [Aminomonas paucivorans]|uniref:TrpR like protein, YerC/YecD n=1 Tax=Aminomonas paucivorans DSM 12260 TaxID=584708 RepID=E3CZG7_9BACT|nr:YerC/YecD family TrpR-related protein [Aminomonas paucivorans]EFQ22859.1 TrpR like protein, YerC/YecD [Aminomonas paucivorans DSM 12260]
MTTQWKDSLTDQLCQALLCLKDPEEAYQFLEDVATIAEIRALSQRLEVARRLLAGETYPVISSQTGASTATISRVKKCVDYGLDGYRLALDRIAKPSA